MYHMNARDRPHWLINTDTPAVNGVSGCADTFRTNDYFQVQ